MYESFRCTRLAAQAALLSAIVAATILAANAGAQLVGNGLNYNTRSVGGISVDSKGMLKNAERDDIGQLQKARQKALQPAGDEMGRKVELRKVSLRRLQAAIAECEAKKEPLPDAIRYLAGLQQIQYVFAVPEEKDVVIAGPGEGWKIDERGNAVGATTGRPVMLLDDLVAALRGGRGQAEGTITCSIDPTDEGLKALQDKVASLQISGNVRHTASVLEKTLGPQKISIGGVPNDSHFARVLLAADYRMKRIAMGFEPSPVRGLPSFLKTLDSPASMGTLMPRWWLTPDYRPLLRDEEGLSWELRGASIKAMTEDDYMTGAGQRAHSGKASPLAQRWADTMTAKYDELSKADAVFGQLKNCVDLAILASLLDHQGLATKAGLTLDGLRKLPTETYYVPKMVDSQASLLHASGGWIVSVSGGVMVNVRPVVDKAERSEKLKPVRDEAKLAAHADWWWN